MENAVSGENVSLINLVEINSIVLKDSSVRMESVLINVQGFCA